MLGEPKKMSKTSFLKVHIAYIPPIYSIGTGINQVVPAFQRNNKGYG
jgi:hypothetical protein